MSDCVTLSYVTSPKLELAQKLAKDLVEKKLAACINIIKDVESIYEWNGKVENEKEYLLIIKSYSTKSKDLITYIEENHPYDCPEVLTVRVNSGSKRYLDWIVHSVNET